MPLIGVLALQGCIDPHREHLEKLGATVRFVRTPKDLAGVQGLILPGGESTTMLKLAKEVGLWDELRKSSIPMWGICAGSILMAKAVKNPQQESLGLMDLEVERNAYGRQKESFQGEVLVDGRAEAAVFIRAPKFLRWGSGVKVRGRVGEEVSFLDDGLHFVTAFHPELTDSSWCHRLFLERVKGKLSSH